MQQVCANRVDDLRSLSRLALNHISRGTNVGVINHEEASPITELLSRLRDSKDITSSGFTRYDVVRRLGPFRSWRARLNSVALANTFAIQRSDLADSREEMHRALELLGFSELSSCPKGLVNVNIGLGLIRGVRSFGSYTFRDLRSALIVKESLFALEDKSSPLTTGKACTIQDGRLVARKVVTLFGEPWWK